ARTRVDRGRGRLRSRLRVRLGDRSGDEPELLGRGRTEPLVDLVGPLRELEGPDRVACVDNERAVPHEPRRPRVRRDPRADGAGPAPGAGAQAGRRSEAAELAAALRLEPLHQAARTSPGETSSSCAGSPGSDSAVVAVISVCPIAATWRSSTPRRPGSSSE